jgi:hypothetical protein
MKDLFWNSRGIRKKGLAAYVRDLLREGHFDFVCFQETVVRNFSDRCLRSIDPNKNFLWDWLSARGKSGVVLSGFSTDRFDVDNRFQGDFILHHDV